MGGGIIVDDDGALVCLRANEIRQPPSTARPDSRRAACERSRKDAQHLTNPEVDVDHRGAVKAGLLAVSLAGALLGCNSAPVAPVSPLAHPDESGAGGTASVGAGGAAGQGGPGGAAGTTDATPPSNGGAGLDGGSGLDGNAGLGGSAGAAGAPDHPDAAVTADGATDGNDADGGGSDDAAPVCQADQTRCFEGCLETCTADGQWGPAITCSGHRTCTGTVGDARCVCKVDAVCAGVGNVCTSTGLLATCAQDAEACFYQAASSPCSTGVCSGPAGQASCGPISCTVGATQCLSGTILETCVAAAGGSMALTTSTCGEGTTCERSPPAACVDPHWAEWRMPNDPDEVADGAPNPPSYTDNRDGTVTDNVTSLMWQQVFQAADAIGEGQATCQNLNLGGHTDWRLPSIIELLSLADFSRFQQPNIDVTVFPGTYLGHFWSLDSPGGFPDNFYTFDYTLHLIFNDAGDGSVFSHSVRCVR